MNSTLRQELIDLAQKEAWARHYYDHDELTGLPNRRLLVDRLNQAIALAKRQGRHVVLLLFDIDGFKDINAQLGRSAGDKLLRETAQRLQFTLRSADIASRYGGNKFVVMLSEIDGGERASTIEQKLRARLDQPYVVDRRIHPLSVSIGRAVYPADGDTCNELILRAGSTLCATKVHDGNHSGVTQKIGLTLCAQNGRAPH